MKYQVKIDGDKGLFANVEDVLLKIGYSWCHDLCANGAKSGCVVIDEDDKILDWNRTEDFGKKHYNNLTKEQFFEKFETGEKELSKNNGVVHVSGNEYLFLALENMFLSKGFNWSCATHDKEKNKELCSINGSRKAAKEHYFYFNLETKNIGGIIDPKKHKVYTLDEIFSLFIFKPITVKLNNQYSAVINKDNVEVGCQTFSFDVLEKVYAAIQKAKS